LEFYFRFRLWPHQRNTDDILHQAIEFRPNRNIHYGNMMSYWFSRWWPSVILYLLWGNGGPPTKCLSWSELGPQIASSSANSSGDIAMCRFWRVGLKLPIHAPFGEFLGHIFPIWRYPLSWPPKEPFLGRNTLFEPFSVKICVTFQPGHGTWTRKKRTRQQKSHKSVIFPIFEVEAPTGPIRLKSCMAGDVHDIITCTKFQIEIFMGYDFTGGWIFDFPIDFWIGLTTVQR